MLDAHAKTWLRGPHVPPGIQESIRELNHRFLDLMAQQPGDWPVAVGGLPGVAPSELAPLSAAQKSAAADCPYALFDLRFHDDLFWQTLLDGAGRVVADQPRGGDAQEFVRLALFFAWHVASSAKLAAQILLGMHEATAAGFRRLTIDCLPALAASASLHLTARWNHCPAYWRALAGAASRPDAAHLRRVQLYGLQLAAAARLD